MNFFNVIVSQYYNEISISVRFTLSYTRMLLYWKKLIMISRFNSKSIVVYTKIEGSFGFPYILF